MSGLRDDPGEVLARARRAWSPSAADAERVRRSIGAALDAGAAGDKPTVGSRTPLWASRFLLAGSIAAASGSLGYWAGHRAGLRDGQPPAPVISLPRPALAASETRPPIAAPAAPERQPLAAPSLVPASRRDGHGARHGSASQATAPPGSLEIEVRALRNAERALRDGNPGLALAFLQELDRAVPGGQLIEERDAAATLVRCARGDHPFGVNLAAEFAEHHPGSVYRARVEEACRQTD